MQDQLYFCRLIMAGDFMWQEHRETRPAASVRLASHSDRTLKSADNGITDPQTESHALLPLCGEERIEDAGAIMGIDAFAIVGDSNANASQGRRSPTHRITEVYGDCSTTIDRVNRVNE